MTTPLYHLVFLSAPQIVISFDGKTLHGKNPNNKLVKEKLGPWPLSGHYSDAVAFADMVALESPDGGIIIQGTTQNTTSDDNCDHEGTTSNGQITFDQPGEYTVIYKVRIHGIAYEASVTVTIKGKFT